LTMDIYLEIRVKALKDGIWLARLNISQMAWNA